MAKTRRTRIGAENGHRGVTSPRLRKIVKATRSYLTSYLWAKSDTIKYGRGLREVGCETEKVLNGYRVDPKHLMRFCGVWRRGGSRSPGLFL